ncbi:hypothetical protein ABG067_000233 [Albugo candida]
MACVAKNLDACVILWSLGADCSLKNKNGMTALMCAARVQDSNDQHSAVSVSIVKGLLERLEAEDIHCVDVLKRNTALHIAVQSGNKGGVKELVKAPGKSLHVYNMDGYTAYALAQHIKASEEVIQILCEHSEMKLAPLDLSEAECVLQSKKKDGKRKSKTKRKQLKNRKDNAQIQKDDPFPYVNHSESVLAAVEKCNQEPRMPVECQEAIGLIDSGFTDVKDGSDYIYDHVLAAVEKCNQEPRMPVECQEAIGLIDSGFTDVKDGSDYIYDQLNAFFHYLNPLAQEIAVNVDAFVVSCPRPILPEPDLDRNIEEILSSLSISQIETLENAHLSAYNALNERKQLKMRVLEAQRVEEKLALQKILTIQN